MPSTKCPPQLFAKDFSPNLVTLEDSHERDTVCVSERERERERGRGDPNNIDQQWKERERELVMI